MRDRWWEVLVATEAVLVLFLLLLAAWQFVGWASPTDDADAAVSGTLAARVPSFGISSVMAGVVALAGLYGALQYLGRTQSGFLLLAVATLLPQGPGIWAHNSLRWGRLVGMEPSLGEGHSLVLSAGLFVASLVGLVVLHRVVATRQLGGLLTAMGANSGERDRVLFNECRTLAGVVGASLGMALLLVIGANALGRAGWLSESLPWAVLAIGGGASVLLTAFTVIFLRGLNRE